MEYVGAVHSDAMRYVRAVKRKQQSTTTGYHDQRKTCVQYVYGTEGTWKESIQQQKFVREL